MQSVDNEVSKEDKTKKISNQNLNKNSALLKYGTMTKLKQLSFDGYYSIKLSRLVISSNQTA